MFTLYFSRKRKLQCHQCQLRRLNIQIKGLMRYVLTHLLGSKSDLSRDLRFSTMWHLDMNDSDETVQLYLFV